MHSHSAFFLIFCTHIVHFLHFLPCLTLFWELKRGQLCRKPDLIAWGNRTIREQPKARERGKE